MPENDKINVAITDADMQQTPKYKPKVIIADPDTNPQAFLYKARALAADAINNYLPIDTHVKPALPEDMYGVWFAKVLGNWKAIVSTDLMNGRYFEITYDGNKNQTYVVDYRKASNTCVTDAEYASAHLS